MKTSTIIKGIQGLADLAGVAKNAKAQGAELVHVGIYVDPAAPAELISWIKSAFVPEKDTAYVHVEKLEAGRTPVVPEHSRVAIIVAGDSEQLVGEASAALIAAGIPAVVVCESSVDAPDISAHIPQDSSIALVSASSQQALRDKLGSWMVAAIPDSLTLAGCFPFVRSAKTSQLIGSCAATNAVVGAISLPSAAQMPIMSLNQAKMALDITSIHGIDEVSQQAPIVAAVVGAGLLYRQVARIILNRLPGLGIVAKAGVAFAGSYATGRILDTILSSDDGGQSIREGFQGVVDSAVNTVMELSQSFNS